MQAALKDVADEAVRSYFAPLPEDRELQLEERPVIAEYMPAKSVRALPDDFQLDEANLSSLQLGARYAPRPTSFPALVARDGAPSDVTEVGRSDMAELDRLDRAVEQEREARRQGLQAALDAQL